MDPLSQSLLGYVLGRAFGLSRPWHLVACVLAANLPDLDSLAWVISPEAGFTYARTLLHGLLPAAILGLALGLVVARLTQANLWIALPIALAAILHPLLDATTCRGAALLYPFQTQRIHWDLLMDLEIWIWTIALVLIASSAISRLVGGEIGTRQKAGRAIPITILLLCLAYAGSRYALHESVVARFTAEAIEGASVRRAIACPAGPDPRLWHTLAETDYAYFYFEPNPAGPAEVFTRKAPKPETTTPIRAASRQSLPQAFARNADAPLWGEAPDLNNRALRNVRLIDWFATFVYPGDRFVSCTLLPDNRVDECVYSAPQN